jgi:polysaccharide pyruvyl transferase WcaK-like protein
MHACIAAISQGIPTVLIAYSDKFQGVMSSIELEGLVVDPRSMDETEIIQTVERVYRAQEDIRAKLATLIPVVKQTIRTSLAQVADPVCAGR